MAKVLSYDFISVRQWVREKGGSVELGLLDR